MWRAVFVVVRGGFWRAFFISSYEAVSNLQCLLISEMLQFIFKVLSAPFNDQHARILVGFLQFLMTSERFY